MEKIKTSKFELTSFHLHLLAMAFMLCDHLWATVVVGNNWMTDVGRLAFPIFAFMVSEGFYHTKNLKKYAKRMFVFALISEIPFNLVVGSDILYPFHQNVLWTFLISIGLMWFNEKAKTKNIAVKVLTLLGTILIALLLGVLSFCDYNYAGIFTVLVFYFFHERKWWCFIAQFICLWYINVEMIAGFEYVFDFLGVEWHIVSQGFAVLALIPIWLYKGKQGYYNKWIKALYYWFYPVHLLILGLVRLIMA